MSSIYRKGRDGYFYYQAYITNSKTGKKDKRVFHALNTKDKQLAQKKKEELDEKYSRSINQKMIGFNFINTIKSKYLKIFIPIFFILAFLFIFSNKGKKESKYVVLNDSLDSQLSKTQDDLTYKNSADTTFDYLVDHSAKESKTIEKMIKEKDTITYRTPDYKIQKSEKLSGAFNQLKLNITIDQSARSQEILELCKKLTSDFSSYSNILINVYSDTDIGSQIALGRNNDFSTIETQKSWLGMYSYNSVEGYYFDDKPGQYLGVYKK